MPGRPYAQPNNYKDTSYPGLAVLRDARAAGTLTPAQAPFMADRRPAEELYDLAADPFELKNLAGSAQPEHRAALAGLRGELERWIRETGDKGQFAEDPTDVRK
jgi:hypothetical protein